MDDMGIGLIDADGNRMNPDDLDPDDRVVIAMLTRLAEYVSNVAIMHYIRPDYAVHNINIMIGNYYNKDMSAMDTVNGVLKLIRENVDPASDEAFSYCEDNGFFDEPSDEVKAKLEINENNEIKTVLDNVNWNIPDETRAAINLVIGSSMKMNNSTDPIMKSLSELFEDENLAGQFIILLLLRIPLGSNSVGVINKKTSNNPQHVIT